MNNILIYNYDEPLPEQGGIERATDNLANELKKAGNEVNILCTKHNRLGKEYESNVPIYYIPNHEPQNFILQIIRDKEINIIIDQTEGGIVGPFGYFKERLDDLKNVLLIAVQHSSRRSVLKNIKLIYGRKSAGGFNSLGSVLYNATILKIRHLHFLYIARKVHKNLDMNYDRTVVLSPAFIDDFIHFYPKADKSKIRVIPNPNTYEKCIPSTLDKKCLYVGRLQNSTKGVDKLLHIWSQIEVKYTDWKLDIVGDGEDRLLLENFARQLGLKNVEFYGFQNPSKFYSNASILCMTSTYEGFPMVLNEAMAHGLVPIVYNTFAAASDIVENNDCGYLIEPFDENNYAHKLSLLMEYHETLLNLSKNAIEHSKLFSRDRIIKMWQNLFDSF